MEPPLKRARVGSGDSKAENAEVNPREVEEGGGGEVDIVVDQVPAGGVEDKLMLSDSRGNTSSHPNTVELAELTRNEDENCFLGDLKGATDELIVGESKREDKNEIRNSWLTEYAEIAFKEKENENKLLKKEYNAFVQEYAKTSNQILKVVAKQKKEITDLRLRNSKQKLQLDVFEKEVRGELKVEATDEKEGILAKVKEESLERKSFAVSFSKVGGDAFKDKEVLMLKGKEEIVSLFNTELRDIEEGMKYLSEIIKVKETEIENKNKALCQETEQRLQLEAQALEAKDAFKEALEAQMDEIDRIKKESNTASPKVDVFKRKLEAKKVVINQLTLEVGNIKAALLAKERESEKVEKEHNAFVQEYSKYSKDSVDVKEAFEEVLEAKEIELEQMRKDVKNKLNNVSHKENFFKEALEAKSVVISQLTMRSENAKIENEDLKSKNVDLRDQLKEERRKQKEELERVQVKEKSMQGFVIKLQSENIEQEDEIALLRHQTRSLKQLNDELELGQRNKVFQLEQKIGKMTAEANSTQDVIFELEACNKKQDDQVDKLEKKICELNLKLGSVNETKKCGKEDLEKQNEVLKERNVSLKMKLIAQNNLQKEEKKSTEKSFNRTIAEMKDQVKHLKMSMKKDKRLSAEKEHEFETNAVKKIDIVENDSIEEASQSKVKAFITQIESTDKVSEIDNLFAAMFSSAEEGRKEDSDQAPVAGSSCTNYTTRDMAFFSSEDEEDDGKKLSRKSNSRLNSQPQLSSPKETPSRIQEVSVVQAVEILEEGEVLSKEPEPGGGRCPLCGQNFPTLQKLEVHASGCMQENSFSLKPCFVLLRNINRDKSLENIIPSKIPHHTIPYLVPGPKIFTVI